MNDDDNPPYRWMLDEWMECAESLARECNALHAMVKAYRDELMNVQRERDELRKRLDGV